MGPIDDAGLGNSLTYRTALSFEIPAIQDVTSIRAHCGPYIALKKWSTQLMALMPGSYFSCSAQAAKAHHSEVLQPHLCPCPYDVDRAGRRCGARSAYSRPGGASPSCYDKDVTQKMVDDYRKRAEH